MDYQNNNHIAKQSIKTPPTYYYNNGAYITQANLNFSHLYQSQFNNNITTPQKRKMTKAEYLRKKEQIRFKKRKRKIQKYAIISAIVLFIPVFFILFKAILNEMKKYEYIVETHNTEHMTDDNSAITKYDLSSQKLIDTSDFENNTGNQCGIYTYDILPPTKMNDSEALERISYYADRNPNFWNVYNNSNLYSSDILKSLANNPELIDYVLNYNKADKCVGSIELTYDEKNASIPHFLQWDSRWGYQYYGKKNCIGINGCAPTCLSMVLVGLTHDYSLTPDKIATFAYDNGYYSEGDGSYWNLIPEGAKYYGLNARELSLDEYTMKNELENGNPIICVLGEGDFTAYGHFIVITNVEDGLFKVNDPNSVIRSEKLWDYATLSSFINNLWVIYN